MKTVTRDVKLCHPQKDVTSGPSPQIDQPNKKSLRFENSAFLRLISEKKTWEAIRGLSVGSCGWVKLDSKEVCMSSTE